MVTLALVATVVAGACSSGSGETASTTAAPPGSSAPPPATSTTSTTAPTATTGPGAGAERGLDWTTYYGDTARTGSTNGGPAAPGASRVRWTSPALDGDVYAQPLIAGNLVVTATANDTVYAIDRARGTITWQRHLGEPVRASALPCGNVDPVGITSTPVVDVRTNRVYVVAMVQPLRHELFVLDLRDGRVIASVPVDAPGADPAVHNQRAALTLANGKVYVPYGGRYGDCGDYRGRVVSVAVTATGLGAVRDYVLPTQGEGGFWTPAGAARASDGSLYFASGNSASRGAYDYGNSVVRLDANLRMVDSFAAPTWKQDNATDRDLGTSTPVLLPGDQVFQVGKAGVGYLLDGRDLGGIGGQRAEADVCGGSGVWGGVAREGTVLAVPCADAVVAVRVGAGRITRVWRTELDTPGPPIISRGVVWVVASRAGSLVALDLRTGRQIASAPVGEVPSRFTSPAAGRGLVVVAGARVLRAFG